MKKRVLAILGILIMGIGLVIPALAVKVSYGCYDTCSGCHVYSGECYEITECCGHCILGGYIDLWCCFPTQGCHLN
jgi:hypothetical protein